MIKNVPNDGLLKIVDASKKNRRLGVIRKLEAGKKWANKRKWQVQSSSSS